MEFLTRLRIAGKTGDQYIEAMSKVCDGLRGDALVAAQEVGSDNLCEIIEGRPSGIKQADQSHARNGFPLTEHESKESFHQYCRPGGPLSRQSGESMKQYVSRRRRYWTLLTQMDPVMHLSAGHRPDMLLDLGGLTREDRVMVQASINNERDFDKVADALIIQHPRVHLRESAVKARRDRAKTEERDTNTRNGKLGASAYHADFISAEDYGHNDSKVETADAYRAHNDPVNLGSEVGKEALDCEDDKKYDMFSSFFTLDDASIFVAAELDAIALLADTWDNDLAPEVSVQLVQANV